MGWKDIPKPKPIPPGQWEEFSYGHDYRGWVLRCPPAFHAHITLSGGDCLLSMNAAGGGRYGSLDASKAAAELAIVTTMRETLPVYKMLVERAEQRREENIIRMNPKGD